MKKMFTLFIALTLWAGSSLALVNGYTFTGSSGVYTPISGGVVLGTISNDDQVFNASTIGASPPVTSTGFPIGFNFTYNGNVYDRFAVNTNGWILLGTGTFTSTVRATRILSSPISFFVTPRTSVTGGIFWNGRFPWRMIICLLFGLGFPPLS